VIYDIKAVIRKPFQLFAFAVAVAVHQFKRKELQILILALPGIQPAGCSASETAWMGILLVGGIIVDFLEVDPTDNTLAANLKRLCIRDFNRDIHVNPDGMGYILADTPFGAACDCLHQLAVLIPKYEC
jgi:hypothetical protein